MRRKSRYSTLTLKQKIYLTLGAIFIVFILFLFRQKSTSGFVKSPAFSGWEYQSVFNDPLMFASAKNDNSSATVNFQYRASSVEMQLPLENSRIRTDKNNAVVFSTPNNSLAVKYSNLSNGIKEDIILYKTPTVSKFTSSLKTTNADIYINSDGLPVFFDPSSNKYLFHVQKPYAYDAKGNKTFAVTYQLLKNNSPAVTGITKGKVKLLDKLIKLDRSATYQLVIKIDPAWLFDRQRAYPITIDPTIIHDTTSEFSTGTMNRIQDVMASVPVPLAVGGTITYINGYTIHTFKGNGTFTPTTAMNVSTLVVAGGGGGGETIGGGGGGGGYISNASFAVTTTPYVITVGLGGSGGNGAGYPAGVKGGNSVFSSLTAIGGGAGAGYNVNASGTGGSAGGNGAGAGLRAAYTAGQGNDGSAQFDANNAGAGGGAGGVGGSATSVTSGTGGIGIASTISGSTVYYAGGGGGGNRNATYTPGLGGNGGGGAGAEDGSPGTAGTDNTGGGGGGGGYRDTGAIEGAGGNGGSGIVVIRYPSSYVDTTPSLQSGYQELPDDQSTIGLWHMNEASGNLFDASGNNNTGVPLGTSVTTGLLGNARNFNGAERVSVGSSLSSPHLTLEAWVYRTSDAINQGIIRKESAYALTLYNNAIQAAGNPWAFSNTGVSIEMNTWTHLAMTQNGNVMVIYKNGIPIGTYAIGGTLPTNTNATYIGYDNNNWWWGGIIDEVRISNVARSAEEIKADASRRPSAVFTSPIMDLGPSTPSWNSLSWVATGVNTGNGELPQDTSTTQSSANIAVGETSSTGAPNVSSLTWNHTVSGSNRLLIVTAGVRNFTTITGVNWGTTPLTKSISSVAGSGNFPRSEIWYLVAPAIGTTNVTVTLGASDFPQAEAITITGVDQTNPLGVGASSSGLAATSTSLTVPSSVGDLVIDNMDFWSPSQDAVPGAGQTFVVRRSSDGAWKNTVSVKPSTSTSTTMTWTFGPANDWAQSGVAIKRATTSSGPSSLIAQWNFNETNGPIAGINAGYCGTPCNGTLVSFANTAGRDYATDGWTANNKRWGDGALRFDGVDDYVRVNNTINLNPTNITLETWFKPASFAAAQNIIDKRNAANTVINYLLQVQTTGVLRFLATGIFDLYTIKPIAFNEWSHIVCTYDGTTAIIYVNGIAVATSASSGVLPTTGDNTLSICRHGTGASPWYCNGVLDSTRIYSRALSANDVLSNYQAGNINLQTRVGNSSNPNDGTWEAWLPSTNESAINSFDTDSANWSWDTSATTMPVFKFNESIIKMEGTGSMEIQLGIAQTDSATVGLWHFNETGISAGTTLYDSSSSNNHGTISGTSIINGIAGKGRNIASGNITVLDSASLKPTNITVESWIKTTATSGWIAYKYNPSSPFQGYGISVGTITASLVSCWVGGSAWTTGTTPVSDGEWHHVACTYDGINVRVYVDGVLSGSQAQTANLSHTTNLNLGNGSAHSLDEIKISNVARSEVYMAEAYRLGRDHYLNRTISSTDLSGKTALPFYIAADRPGNYIAITAGDTSFVNYQPDANTVGLWHLDESTNFIADSSGNNNNAYNFTSAIGGVVTTSGLYTVHTFYSSGTLSVTVRGSVEALVVGGGGGGGNGAGGGGGGGGRVQTGTVSVSSNTNYAIVVGGGGGAGASGGTSSFSTLSSAGGGAGGGSGGTSGSGYAGGSLYTCCTDTAQGGGGGGDSAAGTSGTLSSGGGAGTSSSISGSSVAYGGGGGGGRTDPGISSGQSGGGAGGGSLRNGNVVATAGTANTGGGGGGSGGYLSGANGGSGIVIVRYLTSNTISTQGKIGKGRNFDGNNDVINVGTSANLDFGNNGPFTFAGWVKPTTIVDYAAFVGKDSPGRNTPYSYMTVFMANGRLAAYNGAAWLDICPAGSIVAGYWSHVAFAYNGATITGYVNGMACGSVAFTYTDTATHEVTIGSWYAPTTTYDYNGIMDEISISNIARPASDIRAAFEVGLRSHPITIDFGANLVSSNLVVGSTDYSFNIDATYYGLGSSGSDLYSGDKIIIQENNNGTEYTAQGTVSTVNVNSGAVTVSSWDGGSTFPTSGFTVNASVFKWQREYWNINEPIDGQLDTVTRISLRLTDGNEGRTIWLDDLDSASNYLDTSLSSTITSSPGYRYFQYRSIFSSSDEAVSAALTSVTLDYGNNPPNTPTLLTPTNTTMDIGLTPTLTFSTTDPENNSLQYRIKLCTDSRMEMGCSTFTNTSSQTGWSGQDVGTSAYASGSVATYTVQTPLTAAKTYFWTVAAIDPTGSNTWSNTTNPFTFTTFGTNSALNCRVTTSNNNSLITLNWTDNTSNETGYDVQKSTSGGAWTTIGSGLPPGSNVLLDFTVSSGNTYIYRVAPFMGSTYAPWCTTTKLTLGTDDVRFGGLKLDGLNIN